MKRLALVALLTGACSGPVWVKPTAAGERVRVTNNQEIVRGCDFLGNVVGTEFYGPDEAIAGRKPEDLGRIREDVKELETSGNR